MFAFSPMMFTLHSHQLPIPDNSNQSIRAVTRPCGALSTEQAPNTSFISLLEKSRILPRMKDVGMSSSCTAVISMEFSKNYAFTIQDEAQGYHWTSDSCTILSVMVHCKNTNNEKLILPLCIVSDDLKHDASMVYEIQKTVTAFLRENYPHITNIHYFSDGCTGQYRNKYNFMNLCLHEKDFNLKAQWSFFATSNGKTECDGITFG
ncbi:hypothetical protein AVEN_132076-1 [Araneus ventricosus]|uniref:Uncharacterized protein n=1 Tax=Araneus ventricosus TaxID=182803 RepID=A0A4Y2FBJ9_ARAVE|nr:hypothetical protein AVEN_132076-1 [Araneus ventricosus]